MAKLQQIYSLDVFLSLIQKQNFDQEIKVIFLKFLNQIWLKRSPNQNKMFAAKIKSLPSM